MISVAHARPKVCDKIISKDPITSQTLRYDKN